MFEIIKITPRILDDLIDFIFLNKISDNIRRLKEPIFKRIDLSEYSEEERLEAFEYTMESVFKNMKYANTQPKELLFNENEEINIDLWPSSKSTQEELDSFKSVFAEFGDTSGQISNEPRGIPVETAILFE